MSKRPTFLYETNDAIKKYLGTYLEFDITSHHTRSVQLSAKPAKVFLLDTYSNSHFLQHHITYLPKGLDFWPFL